jgi:hypothetical protein
MFQNVTDSGSLTSVDRCMAIMTRRARLLGLNAPVKVVAKNPTMEQMIEAVENMERDHEAVEARIAAQMDGMEDDFFFDDDLIDEWPGPSLSQAEVGNVTPAERRASATSGVAGSTDTSGRNLAIWARLAAQSSAD